MALVLPCLYRGPARLNPVPCPVMHIETAEGQWIWLDLHSVEQVRCIDARRLAYEIVQVDGTVIPLSSDERAGPIIEEFQALGYL